MKRMWYLLTTLAALWALSRLPHPATDIAKLEPVQLVYIHMEEGLLHLETDTGASGSGETLSEAAENMKRSAPAEIFLETAEHLILSEDVTVTEEFYTLLRPACRVVITNEEPDLIQAAKYLTIHQPELTLAHIRAG